jgi:hypothetical protein
MCPNAEFKASVQVTLNLDLTEEENANFERARISVPNIMMERHG